MRIFKKFIEGSRFRGCIPLFFTFFSINQEGRGDDGVVTLGGQDVGGEDGLEMYPRSGYFSSV